MNINSHVQLPNCVLRNFRDETDPEKKVWYLDVQTGDILRKLNETRFRTVLSKNGFLLVFKALRNQGFSFLLSGLIPAKTLRIRN